jgi:3-methyl-2-oxobutanoate hydroxymethyltransferase
MLASHIRSVKSGIGGKFIIGDLPFMSYRKSLSEAMSAIEVFMKAGANAIKLEGVLGNEEIIKHIIASGVPVMGHLGFTPQSINMYGSSYVQGKGESQAKQLMEAAKKLEDLGCFSMVLECIPHLLAEEITNSLSIPTIGIGAGNKTSGQVLVLQDLIGADPSFNPKFLKKYLDVSTLIKDAVNTYCSDVDSSIFPDMEHSYSEAKNANN